MAYVLVTKKCLFCGRGFKCTPKIAPSFRDCHGVDKYVCLVCMRWLNKRYRNDGLTPYDIPEGSYRAINDVDIKV